MSEIDLHTHSTASDGTLSPWELVQLASESYLKAMALTDHDTTKGLRQALKAGDKFGLEVLPGCELSLDYPQGIMHMIGLWISPDSKKLKRMLEYIQEINNFRNETIVRILQKQGVNIDYSEIKELSVPAHTGRVRIARLLLEAGVAESMKQIFEQYLGPSGKAYLPEKKLKPKQAIDLLKSEQATVILAHPYTLELEDEEFVKELKRLKDKGLDGLEVYHTFHSPKQTAFFEKLSNQFGLLKSCGSDFHGHSVRPGVYLGKGRGNLNLPYSLLETMKDQRRDSGFWIR